MRLRQVPAGSGHVFRRDGARDPVWYAKFRLPDGRQLQRRIAPAWTRRGRPAAGWFTESSARDWLYALLEEERERHVPGGRLGEVTFAEAAREWLRYVEVDRAGKPSTMLSYRSSVEGRLIPAFGDRLVAEIEPVDLEVWRARLPVGPRTKNKLIVELHGIFRRAMKAYGLRRNLGVTSVYLQGVDNAEIIDSVHGRRPPMLAASAGLRSRPAPIERCRS